MTESRFTPNTFVTISDPQFVQKVQAKLASLSPDRLSHAEFEDLIAQKYHCELTKHAPDAECCYERFTFAYDHYRVIVYYSLKTDCETIHVDVYAQDSGSLLIETAQPLQAEMRLLFGLTAHDLAAKTIAYQAYCLALGTHFLIHYAPRP